MAFGLFVLEVERIAQSLERDVIGLLQAGKRRFPLLGTGGNERLEVGAIGIVFALQAAILQGPANRGQQLLSLERLEQVVIRPIAQRLQSDLNVVDRRDHDNRHVRVAFLGTLQKGNPIHFGHHQVGEDKIEFVTRFQDREGFDATGSLTSLKMSSAEHGGNNLANCLLVVYHEDAVISHGAK